MKPFNWVLGGFFAISLTVACVAPALAVGEGVCLGVPRSFVVTIAYDGTTLTETIAGASGDQTQTDFFLQRYSDSSCIGDPTFGPDATGIVTDRVDANTNNVVRSVVVGSDSRIAMRGITQPMPFFPWRYAKAIYEVDGTRTTDFLFDDSLTDFNLVAVVQQIDGKTLAIGDGARGSRVVAVKRENADLNLDLTYAVMGNAVVDLSPNSAFAGAGALQNDGTTVVGGGVVNFPQFNIQGLLVKIGSDGITQLTRTFNFVATNDAFVSALVSTGGGGVGGGASVAPDRSADAIVFCYNIDLSFAETCGVRGIATINVVSGNNHFVRGLASRGDGSGYYAAIDSCGRMPGDLCQTFVACVNPDLSIASSRCVNGGINRIDAGPGDTSAATLTVRADGTVRLAGNVCAGDMCQGFRWCGDPSLISQATCSPRP